LELSQDRTRPNSTLRHTSVVDLFKSLNFFPFWYHNHYSLTTVIILVASTWHAPLTSRIYLRWAKRPIAVLSPPSTWHVCAVVLVLSPLSHWHCCPQCAGIIALIAQASLPLLCLHCAVNLQAPSPLLSWHVLNHGRHGRLRCRQWQHQRNKGDDASATRAATPAQWGPWCQHKDKEGDNASVIDDASMIRADTRLTRATTQTRW
jgi:hypothetical protein